ncbi:MAG: hypothetical protein KAU49_05435 [Candidatus Krumholzibacteria bacterium]|nr:hypothetical protein [Candidatus Krumholzibacteria bacterium]
MSLTVNGSAAKAGIFCIVLALICIVSQADATTDIGIYVDEGHSECSSYPALYQVVNFWVWVLPGNDGMICVEYEITTPANVIEAATTVNPEAGYSIGDAIVPPGATVCFPTCRTDWIWIHQLTCLVTDSVPSIITLDPHGDYGIMRALNCIEPGEHYETMTKVNDVYLFQECVLANQESSWGAIKSLLK